MKSTPLPPNWSFAMSQGIFAMGLGRGGVRGRQRAPSGADRCGSRRSNWGFAAASLPASFGGGRSGIPACRRCAGGRRPVDPDRTTADNSGRGASAVGASPFIGSLSAAGGQLFVGRGGPLFVSAEVGEMPPAPETAGQPPPCEPPPGVAPRCPARRTQTAPPSRPAPSHSKSSSAPTVARMPSSREHRLASKS